ncbi:hypothetical protein KUW18_10245 [Halomonas sp. DP5Y7-2]|uniref:hypothetical protein n=1 Tax=Halomonas sp. DP5Y7-2 TaxID=2859076 RepID=UPI001C99AB3D|nr:hypothetical protein [Halomonas sp. DP5Y7-2]MBY5984470.1 hypothetical protein [Halomonas sp. DP5Y7-2]
MTFGLATVWMLAETLKIQRQELKDTRSELESTRKVHEQSAKKLQQQYELMLADYRRRNFKEHIDNMLSPIDAMQSATKISQNNTWTFFDAVKNNRLERFFENEIRVMVHQFVIIADTYSDKNLSFEDKVYLEKEISRCYYLFAHAKKSGYFNKCEKGAMHELWKFYCRVNARVEGTDSK